MAVCFYKLRKFDLSLKNIADIIERGIKEHPELSVDMQTDGIEVASVGNTIILHESCLVEAFNLKAAIQFTHKNCKLSDWDWNKLEICVGIDFVSS